MKLFNYFKILDRFITRYMLAVNIKLLLVGLRLKFNLGSELKMGFLMWCCSLPEVVFPPHLLILQ